MAYDRPNFPTARTLPAAWTLAAWKLAAWCGACWIGALAPGGQAAIAQEQPAQELLRDARAALEAHPWVSAKIHQEIDLYRQQLIGNGFYRHGPPETHWMLMDLNVKVGAQNWVIQQRCDGDSYWQCTTRGKARSVTRVDLERLRNVRDEEPAQFGSGDQLNLGGQMGLGGLPKLLGALDKAFEFKTQAKGDLREQPMYRLRGQWRTEWLVKWLPQQKAALAAGKPADLGKLPPPIPDHVFVYLGRDDLFPYRIEYRRDDPQAPDGVRKLVTLDLYEVVFDEPVDESEFSFEPGDTPVDDQTEIYAASRRK